MKKLSISWLIYTAISMWMGMVNHADGKPDAALLREFYEQPQRKQLFEKYFSDPNEFRSIRKRMLDSMGVLPRDEYAARRMVERHIKMDGLLCNYVYKGKEIEDVAFLKEVYSNPDEPGFMRAHAAFLLYLRTGQVEFAVSLCRLAAGGALGLLAELRDPNFELILTQIIAGAWLEAAPRQGAKDFPRDFPDSTALAMSYGQICRSIFLKGLDTRYAVFMFERMDDFQRFSPRPLCPAEISLQILTASRQGCKMFIASRIEAGDIKGIEKIRAASPELAALVREVSEEQIAKYNAIKNLHPVRDPNSPGQ